MKNVKKFKKGDLVTFHEGWNRLAAVLMDQPDDEGVSLVVTSLSLNLPEVDFTSVGPDQKMATYTGEIPQVLQKYIEKFRK